MKGDVIKRTLCKMLQDEIIVNFVKFLQSSDFEIIDVKDDNLYSVVVKTKVNGDEFNVHVDIVGLWKSFDHGLYNRVAGKVFVAYFKKFHGVSGYEIDKVIYKKLNIKNVKHKNLRINMHNILEYYNIDNSIIYKIVQYFYNNGDIARRATKQLLFDKIIKEYKLTLEFIDEP